MQINGSSTLPELLPNIDLAITIAGLVAPILLYFGVRRFSHSGGFYLFGMVLLSAIFAKGSCWFENYSDDLLLSHYGYDESLVDEFRNVTEENIDKVEALLQNKATIGWRHYASIIFAVNMGYYAIIYLLLRLIVPLFKTSKGEAGRKENKTSLAP